MKKVLIFTSTRAEYGLLKWIIKSLTKKYKVYVTVGGTHLSYEDGYTMKEIINNQVENVIEIPFLLSSRTCSSLNISIGNGLIQMSQIFDIYKPDYTVVLGDRYELFIPTITSLMFNVPVMHLHGGEITEGVIDEQVRHAITKIAHIHLPCTKFYAENISKMGEEDWRIYIVGAPGLENAVRGTRASAKEVKKELGIDLKKRTILCTYHPVTLEPQSTKSQTKSIINSLMKLKDFQVIFTRPNAEVGSEIIISEIKKGIIKNKNQWFFFNSLGINIYQSILKHSKALIGNSSSGIFEAPFFKIPTVDIGNRQKGRHKSKSIISCGNSEKEITLAIKKALFSNKFRQSIRLLENSYGDGRTSEYVLMAFDNIKNLEKEKILKKKLDYTVKKDEWNKYF